MPRASRSPTTPADARRGPYMPRPPASEEDRLPVHPRKNKVPADKRKRVAMACHECNVRRVKCTGIEPCEQCKHNGRACCFPRADAKRQVSGIVHDHLAFRSEKLDYLAGVAARPIFASDVNPDGPDPELQFLQMQEWESMDGSLSNSLKRLDARMLIDSAGTARLFGRSSGACFLDGVKEVIGVAGPLAKAVGHRYGSGYGKDFLRSLGYYQTYDSRRLHLSIPAPYSIPPAPEVDGLFDLVRMFLLDGNGTYESGGALYWEFPSAAFVVGVAEDGKMRPNHLPPAIHHRPKFALGHVLLAFGRLLEASGPDSRVEGEGRMGENHYSTAKWLIGGPLDGNANTKEELPILALMALYLVENNRRGQASHVIGLAIDIAVAQGMHQGWCADEGDVRTFWTLYVIDRWLACVLGRPVKIQDQDIRVRLPRECKGLPPHHGLLANVKLSQISQAITYDNFFRNQPRQPGQESAAARVTQDLRRLSDWKAELPEVLDLKSDPLGTITLPDQPFSDAQQDEIERSQKHALAIFGRDRAVVSLHMSYNQLIIVAVRPAYLAAVQKVIASLADVDGLYELHDDSLYHALQLCTEAAQRNLRLGWVIQQQSPRNRLLVPDLHHIFNAALILIMHQIVSRNYRVTYSYEIDWATDVFKQEAQLGSPFAQDCSDVLKDFHHLAKTLNGTIHSLGAKQYIWESQGDRLKRALGLPLPPYTFSVPFQPLCENLSPPTPDRVPDKIGTISELLNQWRDEGQEVAYRRPLS